MKIIFNQNEILELIKRSFPPEMIPKNYSVESVEVKGYPAKDFEITLEKEEEAS